MKKSIVSIIILIILSVVLIPILQIKNAQLQSGSTCLEEKELLTKVDKKNIILLNTKKVKEEIKSQSTCVKDIKITKKYPNTVEFLVVEKKAVAKIQGSENSATEDGLIILEHSDAPKPTLFLPQGVEGTAGQNIKDPAALFALKLLKYLEKSDFIPASARIIEYGDIAVYSNQEAIALFTQGRSVDSQVDSLQAVIAKAKIDPSKIAKIDLRFDKPVLIYK